MQAHDAAGGEAALLARRPPHKQQQRLAQVDMLMCSPHFVGSQRMVAFGGDVTLLPEMFRECSSSSADRIGGGGGRVLNYSEAAGCSGARQADRFSVLACLCAPACVYDSVEFIVGSQVFVE